MIKCKVSFYSFIFFCNMLYINIPVFTFQDKKINNYYLVHASDKGRDKYLPDDRVFKRHYEFFILSEFYFELFLPKCTIDIICVQKDYFIEITPMSTPRLLTVTYRIKMTTVNNGHLCRRVLATRYLVATRTTS
jgi:hypothetical protein